MRPHLFSGVQTFSLEDDSLAVEAGGAATRIPYTDIESIRLIRYANVEELQAQCTIKTKAHGELTVRSHHFKSLGAFEDRSATYAPFIRELCRRVHAANAEAKFIWGSRGLQIAWLIVFALAAAGGLIWIAVLLAGTESLLSVVSAFAVLLLAGLLGLRSFAANKVEYFDPSNPPVP